MRSRSGAFVRIILLALALTLSAASLGAAAPASAGSGADAPGAARALRALLVAQQAQLTAADGAAEDHFGYAVAVSGDTVVVGAEGDDVGANSGQGSVYVFVRSIVLGSVVWDYLAQLTADDGASADWFGASVAISGDTIVVGALGDDVGATVDQGSAYVFKRSGMTWTQRAKLTAADGAYGDRFGQAVAISGDTIVVGAHGDDVGDNVDQGSAYIFTGSGATWREAAQLTATGGASGDSFGISVAIWRDTVVVGAPGDDVGGDAQQGSARVFVRSAAGWTQQAQLTAADGAADDLFGQAVAIRGGTVVVGAPYDGVGDNAQQGSACVFARSAAGWTQQAQLTAADGARNDHFGWSVAISRDTVVVGAPDHNVDVANSDQGSAYVFMRGGARWTQQASLTAADGAAYDYFGEAAAISGPMVVIGAWGDRVGFNAYQGSAAVFRIARPARPTARTPKGRISSRRPIFRWRTVAEAATYEVRIYKGSRLLKRQAGIAKTAWKCTKRLPRKTWLTWKVRARNVAGYGAYSAKLRFKVR